MGAGDEPGADHHEHVRPQVEGRLGERGLFFIPSAQGYGSLGAGDADDVPPFADLLFDIELLAVTAGQ